MDDTARCGNNRHLLQPLDRIEFHGGADGNVLVSLFHASGGNRKVNGPQIIGNSSHIQSILLQHILPQKDPDIILGSARNIHLRYICYGFHIRNQGILQGLFQIQFPFRPDIQNHIR